MTSSVAYPAANYEKFVRVATNNRRRGLGAMIPSMTKVDSLLGAR
jgi:hypothetical protein